MNSSETEPGIEENLELLFTSQLSLLPKVVVEAEASIEDPHESYRGTDFRDSSSHGFDVTSDFNPSNTSTAVTTHTHGGRDFWVLTDSCKLTRVFTKQRLCLPNDDPVTWIRSTCMVNLKQCCHGNVIAFCECHSPDTWYHRIVDGIFYLRKDNINMISINKWTGQLAEFGVPDMFLLESWNDMLSDTTLITCPLESTDMYFVNQVQGKVPQRLSSHPQANLWPQP